MRGQMGAAGSILKTDVSKPTNEDGKPNINYWFAELEAGAEASRPSIKHTDDAFEEFLAGEKTSGRSGDGDKGDDARFSIYWASVRTIQPALYSRTPIPVVEKNFDDLSDGVGGLASMCLERLAKYLLRSTPFDRVFYKVRDSYIHGGKAAPRISYEADISEGLERKYYSEAEDGVFYDEEGSIPDNDAELDADEQGVYAEVPFEKLDDARIVLTPLHHRDYRHTPNARHEEEITWKAFKSLMTEQECAKRFKDSEMLEKIVYRPLKEDKDGKRDSKVVPTLYATIWEIWDINTKQTYWLDENYKEDFLEIKSDMYDLSGFFPAPPFMLGTVGADDMYPVPDFVHVKPFIKQLHGMAQRLKSLVSAARRRGLFDDNVPELAKLNKTDEAQYIGVQNLARLLTEKGGLDRLVWHFPTQEIVNAIREMAAVIDLYEQKFNQIYGIPDILRGVSDPNETAAAQQLKGKYLSLRFSSTQREFQRLVRDTIELMCDLALKQFPEEKLIKIMGVQQMDPQQQAMWPQVLALLQDDTERQLRINIETDSTITMNENAEIEQRNYLAKSLFDGLSAISKLGQNSPALMPTVAATILYVVRGVRDSAQIESSLEQALQLMLQQAQQPQQQGQDGKAQEAASKAQIEMAKIKANLQVEQQKRQLQQQELQIESQKLILELRKISAQEQNAATKTALQAQIAGIEQAMNARKLEIEAARVELDMEERFLTEARLQRQEQREANGLLNGAAQ